MIYKPTINEINELRSQMNALPARAVSLENPNLHVSGSSWGKDHLDSLRVVCLDNLPLRRFFPPEVIPSDRNPAFVSLAEEVTALDEDGIRGLTPEASAKLERSNRFMRFFQDLSKVLGTKRPYIPFTNRPPSTGSISSSGDEDKEETPTRECFKNFLSAVLANPDICRINKKWWLDINSESLGVEISFGSRAKLRAENDGGVVLRTTGSYSGSSRIDSVPIISFESKRRNAGGKTRGAGEEEKDNDRLLAQELAELLGQVMVACREKEGQKWIAQDAWAILRATISE